MKKNCSMGLIFASLLLVAPVSSAETSDDPESHNREARVPVSTTPLADILDSVSKKSGKKFLVDRSVRPEVVIGQLKPKEINYSSLLLILRNNDLAGVTVGDVVNVVPVRIVRQYPLPVLFEDDPSIDGEEWVTRVIQLENAEAPMLVPIMRPLLPQAGHLAANSASNTILIVDRYANVQRVTKMIFRMDALTPPQPRQVE